MPNILVNNSSKKKKKNSAESSASTTSKNNPYIEGSKRRAVQDAINNYNANQRKAEQIAADRDSMMSLYSMHTAPTESQYNYAKRKLNTAANNYYNGYDDNLFHPNAKKALESTQKLYTDAKNRKELDDFTKQFETYTKKEQEKNNFRNMTYEDLRKTIDSGYLSSEQSKWAEDVIRTKANSEQATDRANYLNEQAARLEQDLYDRYGGTPAYFGIHEQDMYSRQQKEINNLRRMAEQYAGQAWIAEGLEKGEEAVRSATYEKDYMMVPNRAYNEQYSGIFGLISDDEIQTKEGIAGARARAVMTDEEKLKYSALYNTQGPDAAKRYFDSLTYDLDERLQNRKAESVTAKMDAVRNADNLVPNVGIKWLDDYIEKAAKQSLEGSAFVNARLNNLASGIGALDATFQRLANTGGKPVNWNTESFTPHTVSQAIQESQLSQIQSPYNPQLESLGKFAYQTGGSMIDSLGIVGASVLGIPGATAILGMSAATDSMLKAKERGATDGQAVSVGILAGVAETLFEEVSLEKLLTAGTPATIAEAIKNIFLRQGVTEASEEVATTIANTITDAMIMGDKSELKTNIQRYVDMGYSQSDAERLGGIDWLKDLFMDALGGFVSGAMFGAGQQAFSYANYMSGLQGVSNATTTSEAIERMSDMVPTLLDGNGQITDSRAAADRLQKTYEETMGRLSKNSVEAEEAIYANNAVIDEAVKQGQLTKEEGEQAKQITRMLVEQQEAATRETVKQQSRTEQTNRDILKKLSDQSDAKISTTQAIVDNYNGKSLPTEYFGAWRYYEQSGMQAKANGEKNTFNAMFMNDTRYDGVISRAAAQTAYAAGFTMPQSDRVTRQIKEMGEGIFKASAKALEELAKHVDNVDATVSFLTAVAKRSGLNIDLDEALKGKANGQFFAAVMTMAISPDANIVSTVFHEGGHAIERYDPKSYAQLKADMLDWYAQTKGMKDVDAMAASYADTYKGYSRSEIETEMVNDAFGSLFNAEDAAKDLANWMAENKTEAEQKTFKEKLSELIDRVIKWMKSLVTLKGTNPMQRRTAEMQAKQAQEFRKAFLSALDTAVAKAKSTGEFSVDTTATRYDSVASARSMIDYSMNLATFNYADKYVQMDDEKRKQLSLLKDALIEVRGIEVEIKKIEKRGLHNIHQINETLATHPEIHQKLVDVQDRLNRAGISCNFVSQVGEEVRVEGRRVAPGMLGLPIEYVDAEKGARFIGERTSEDEVRHAGYKFAAFKRAIPQMLLDSIRVDVRESLRAELIKAVEDAYKRRDTSEILDDYSKAFPITLEELNEVLGVNVDREAIHAGLNKGLEGVQAALKYADKTLLALNTNAACPMFTIGNHGCYLDSCYVTQMGSGMMGTNLFTTAWYAGELLQLNQDTIDKMNKTGGLRINGAGDTTMDNVSQLVDVLKHAAMRGLKIKIITKQLTTFDLLSKAKKAGVNLKGVTVQPSMDNIWIPAELDNVYGSGFRGNTQMSKTFEKAIALRDAGNTAEAERLFENLQVVYDDVFGRATRIAPMVDDKGNPVLDADGNPVNTLYRKYGFSTEQVNDMITRAKKEYPEVTVTPRYVVCTPQEIAEIALNKHGLIVNGGAIIQTLMHGKVPKGCFSDYGTELLNFNALRHVVERKNGVWDFYGELVGYETKTDTDENGNIIYDKKGKPKKVDVRDENGNFVVRRVRPKPSKTSPYEKVKAWVNGVLDDGTPRYTEEEKNIIWLTLKESMCCQASDSKDACAGCASLCANGAYVASIQSRQEAYLKQVQPGEALPDWAEIDDSETTETSEDVVDLSLRVNDYSEFKDQIGDAEWGVNVNDKTQAFTEQILDELKTIETRNSPSLRHLIGQRVGIVRTGTGKAMLVGFVTITGEKVYNSLKEFQDDADAHKVTGGKYGWKNDTEVKYGYTLSDPQWLVDDDGNRVEIPMDGYGVVKRALAPKDVADLSKEVDDWLDDASIYDIIAEEVEAQESSPKRTQRRIDEVNKRLKEIGLQFNGTSTAAWTDERIDKYLGGGYYGSDSNPNYAQAHIAYMTPQQYLNLTMGSNTATVDRIQEESAEYGPVDFNKLGESGPIYIMIEKGKNGARVVGHEGRHRMLLLGQAGFSKVPVLLFDSSDKYGKATLTNYTLRPQKFYDTGFISEGRNVVVDEAIPFSQGNRELIKQKFGSGNTEADVRYSKAVDDVDPETAVKNLSAVYMAMVAHPENYDGTEEERLAFMDYIVRKVAEYRGFTTPKLYHGTLTFGHTKFEHGGSGIFVAVSKKTAMSYARSNPVVREIGTTGHYKTSADLLQAFNENTDEKSELINRDAQKEIAKKSIAKDNETMERLTSEEMSDMFDENGDLQYIGGPALVRDRERVREQVSSMFDDLWSNFLDVVICKNELMKAIESGSTDGLDYSIEDLEDTILQAREASKPEDLVKWVDKYWYGPNMKRQLLKSVISEMADAMERAGEIIPIAKNTSGEDMISYHYLYDSDDITLLTLEKAKELIDYGAGMYQLYGNPGDKVLVVECNGRHWNELGDLVERSEELQDLYEEEWDKDEDWWADEDYADWVVTDDITERAAMAGYTSVLFMDIHDGGPIADEYVFFDSSQIKSADTITYDDDGNIIPPSERFSENEDVRWSKMRSNGLTAEEQKALQKRVKEAERNAAREQKRAEEYKAEMKVTPKFTPDAASIAELANELAHTFSTENVDVPGLEQKLKDMFTLTNEAASSGKEKFATQALDLATEIATDIVDNALADFVNVSANGKALRSELISMQANAVMDRILQTKMAKSTKADKWNAKVQEAKAKLEATEKELGKTATYAIREAKKVERLEQEFNAYKQKMADKVAYLKAKTDAEIAFNNQYYRERIQKLREQYKAKYNRDMFAQREHYRGKIANIREQQKAEKSLKRLTKSVNALREMLSPKNAKNLQYVPDLDNGALKAAVADYLSTVDFVTKTMARTGVQMKSDGRESSRLDAIRKIAEAAKNKQSTQDAYYVDLPDYAVEYIDSLKEWITSLMSSLETARSEGWLPEQFHARVANSDMLDLFNTLTVNITHAIQNINRTYVNARFAHVGDMALSTYNYLKDMKRTKGLSSNLSWSLMTPYYAFQRFGEGGKAVFEGLADGFDRFGMLSTQIKNKLLKTKDNPNGLVTESQRIEWGKEVKTINGTDAHGEKITLELTAAQLMSLYCLSRRDAALDHLYIGGITLRDQKSGRKEITNESPVHVTVEQVHEAVSKLSPEQIHVAQELQKFMSNECAAWGNEVTMERWGVNLLNEQFYFPMTTYDAERGTVSATDDQSANLYALDNSGFMKPLQKNASNALVLDNIFKVFGDHAANMAKYSALVLPMLDAMRWYNWSTRIEATTSDGGETETPVGVMPEIRKVFGDDATKYFRKLMSDLNNAQMEGGVNYGLYEKFLSNYKAASVAANLRVAALQPTSIARAAMVISPSYIVKGAAMKGGLAEMTKYSGIWAWKNFGMYGTDVGRSLRRQLAGETTKLKAAKNTVVEWSLKAAEFGDQIAWAALWNACRLEQQAQHPGVEYEALMELTRRRFNEVIFSTQVFDSTLSRADIMRKQDTGYKMATAFMAEPLLSANMVTNAFVQYSMDAQKTGKGEAWKKHGNKITRALAVYTVTNLAAAIAESIMDAYRDDDDDPWLEKFLEHLVGDWSEVDDVQSFLKAMYGGNLVQDMSVIGKIPMLKDLVSFMQGYDIGTRMDMQGISNLLNVLAIWNEKINIATGKLDKATRVTWWGNMTLYGAIYKSLQAASQVTGVPAYNALRDITPIFNKTIGAITGFVFDTYETAKDRAVKGLKEKNGMTDAEADIAKSSDLSVDQITNYYTKTYEKLGTTPKAAGIPFDVYESYLNKKKETGASNKASIMAIIDEIGGTHKDELYYMAGYAESTIDEAPWH